MYKLQSSFLKYPLTRTFQQKRVFTLQSKNALFYTVYCSVHLALRPEIKSHAHQLQLSELT